MSGASPAVGNDKPTPLPPKKRTAAQAGLDNAVVPAPGKGGAGEKNKGMGESKEASGSVKKSAPDGKDGVSGKDWLIEQVAKMESAFKDACYYRALIIRFHVEARYHNLHYVQPNAPRYMVDRYRKACLLWEETKGNVQRYLEEAAKRYVPPVAPVAPVKPEIKTPSTPIVASNSPSQHQTGAKKSDTILPYIDPRTGLPSPTQPSSLKIAETAAVKPAAINDAKLKVAQNGRPPSAGANRKSPALATQDSGRKKSVAISTPIDPSTSANSSVNAKFPTGSAGDPIEIDDLDVDMDNDGDVVHLVGLSGNGSLPLSKANTQNIPTTIQPEGIGLGLGIGEINVDLPVAQIPTDPASVNMGGDVSALLQNIQNAVAATAGEAQLSEEDIMKFFESLPPGGEAGGQAEMGSTSLMGDNGRIDGSGLGTVDQLLGNPSEAGGGLPLNQSMAASADGINVDSMGTANAGDFGSFESRTDNAMAAPATGDGGMSEELDLSNMDWTQYSALLADIPDES